MFEHAALVVSEVMSGRAVALAVVTSVGGSAPRPLGTSMVVTSDGSVLGSVSGGCVESAVLARADEVLAGGAPSTEVFGYGDPEAFAIGLACGGTVEVLVTRVDPGVDTAVLDVWRAAAAGRGADLALAVAIRGACVGRTTTRSGAAEGVARLDAADGSWLVARPAEPADFLVYGGVDVAAPLVTLARMAGYRVTVVDARPAFARIERFPDAHEVVRAQPVSDLAARADRPSTVVCVLTHEDRFDVPVLVEALRRGGAFVGAMGSRSTTAARRRRLQAAGLTPTDLDRLHAPIGLDLGGRSAHETAIAIMAEVIAARHGHDGRPLRESDGPLHAHVTLSARPATPDRG